MSSQHLLSSSTHRADSSEVDEEDDLLVVPVSRPLEQEKKRKKMFVGLGASVVVVLGLLVALWEVRFRAQEVPRTNMILMISDGFGPASETFARDFYKHLHGLTYTDPFAFPLDKILVGSSRTRSSNSLVTDSAAGATAFSCAQKTYNGAVSVEAEGKHRPLGTTMEAAKRDGFMTGVVVTSRVTHATPACFYSHVVDRDMESEIAEFLVGDGPLGHVVDLALGGGQCFFHPNTSPESCRTDSKDLLESAREKKRHLLLSGNEYEKAVKADEDGVLPLPVLGLFNSDHMNYDIDRQRLPENISEPALKDMAGVALKSLHKAAAKSGKDGKGMFLMIEGSRIDMGAHSNDPANHARDVFAYQETVQVVLDWIDALPPKEKARTVMISVSDHETGGLALARQLDPAVYPTYAYYPEHLENVTHSTIFLGEHIASRAANGGEIDDGWLKQEIIGKGLGVMDATEDEIKRIKDVKEDPVHLDVVLADMVSRRAQLAWSTHGHSGVDVNLYMYPFRPDFHGSKENTEIGAFIASHLSLDLESVTERLNDKDIDSWFHWKTTSDKEKGGQQKKKKRRGVKHFHSCQCTN